MTGSERCPAVPSLFSKELREPVAVAGDEVWDEAAAVWECGRRYCGRDDRWFLPGMCCMSSALRGAYVYTSMEIIKTMRVSPRTPVNLPAVCILQSPPEVTIRLN